MYKGEYEVLGNYVTTHVKVEIKHVKCGHVYEVSPANFLRGRKCPRCANKIRKYGQRRTQTEFEREVHDLVGDEYSFLEKYANSVTSLAVRHNICGHEYRTTPGNFIHHNKRCPKCLFSRGEERVASFLDRTGVNYKAQYTFTDCRNTLPLPFDFAVLDGTGKVKKLIEYDGEFHYKQKFRTVEEFELQKKRDAIKSEYCAENGIELIRIPYWDFDNIDAILECKID